MAKRFIWTRARLHQHLLKLLERPQTTLEYWPFRNGIAGSVDYQEEFPPNRIKIKIDGNNGDLINLVVHELLHVVFSEMVAGKIDETLEEVFVVAFDLYMTAYVRAKPSRVARWEKLIKRKLAESEARKEPVPLEELVDRSAEEARIEREHR